MASMVLPAPTKHFNALHPWRAWTLHARSSLEQRLLLVLGLLQRPAPPHWPVASYNGETRRAAGHLEQLTKDEVHYVATDRGCLLARAVRTFSSAPLGQSFLVAQPSVDW